MNWIYRLISGIDRIGLFDAEEGTRKHLAINLAADKRVTGLQTVDDNLGRRIDQVRNSKPVVVEMIKDLSKGHAPEFA